MNKLIERLSRYSKQCLTERLDADFAEAIFDAIDIIKSQQQLIRILFDTVERMEHELQ